MANITIRFDTGADISLLMPVDGLRMGVDYADLGNTEVRRTWHILPRTCQSAMPSR